MHDGHGDAHAEPDVGDEGQHAGDDADGDREAQARPT